MIDEMDLFNFEISQLDKPMNIVFGVLDLEEIGISKGMYKLCKLINKDCNDNLGSCAVNMSLLNYHGFDSTDEFKSVYARAKLYHSIRFNPSLTLRQFTHLHQEKIKLKFGKHVSLKRRTDSFNILKFLLNFTLDELLCVSW